MRDNRYPLMINGVAVVWAPDEIDAASAGQLRAVLLEAGRRGHARVVVDMSRTRFCDSAGFSALAAAHKRALAEDGGLQLVIPDGSRVLRIFTVIGLGRFIPRFASLDQALLPPGLARRPAAADPMPPASPGMLTRQDAVRHARSAARSGSGS